MACIIACVTLISAWPLAWTPLNRALQNLPMASSGATPQISGTIWRGAVKGLEPVGTLRFRLSPLQKLKGGSLLTFASSSRAITARGAGNMSGVSDVSAKGELGWILPKDRRFGGIQGGFDLTFETLEFDRKNFENGCTAAKGLFVTDVLKRNQSIWYWVGPNLSGPIRCEDGDLVTDLKGVEDGQDISVRVKMQADGIYSADVQVITNTQGADAVLSLYGFTKSGRIYSLTETGKWR